MRKEITLQNGDRIIIWADPDNAVVTVRHISDDGAPSRTITFGPHAANEFNVAFQDAQDELIPTEAVL